MQDKISQIQQVALELKEMEEDKEQLFERINNLSPDAISQLIEDYKQVLKAFKPVNLLRYEVLKALDKGNKVDEDFVENLKERIRKKDTEYFAHYGDELTEGLRNYREGTKDIFTVFSISEIPRKEF